MKKDLENQFQANHLPIKHCFPKKQSNFIRKSVTRKSAKSVIGRGTSKSRSALTLLEIIISIVIIGGVVTILTDVARSGLKSARLARELTQAELICNSLMGMVKAGIIPLDPDYDVPLPDDYPDSNVIDTNGRRTSLWLYSLDVYSTSTEGLVEVSITVRQDKPLDQKPVTCQMVRWMIDPTYLEDMEAEMDEILNPDTGNETE
ncbi:MAG: hypothetical protein ACRC2T_00215 [Thermoguttaceae bacterium]